MSTWLVTGATGFLGANAGLFLDEGTHRIGLARGSQPAPWFDQQVMADLLDSASLRNAVRSAQPDVILHCAALASHEECEADPALAHRLNVEATRVLAESAAAVGSTFIYVSTDSVFDGSRGHYRETDEPNPFSVYGETKLLGEAAAIGACADTLVVRTNFFGWSPTHTRSILEFFVNALRAGRSVQGFTDFIVTSIYARHLIAIIEQLAKGPRRGIVHAASADAVSKLEFGRAAARAFGLPAQLITPVSAAEGRQATSRARNLSLETSLLASILGALPPTQAQGIAASCHDESTVRDALQEGMTQRD